MQGDNDKFIIAVEGNIGVGKGAALNILKQNFDTNSTCIKKEPIHKWLNIDYNKDCNYNLLDKFYSDTERWSYAMQVRCTTTRIQEYEKINKPLAFCERSWYTDRYVFTETLSSLDLISSMEKALYDDFYRWITTKTPEIDAIIYLRASPDTCFARSMNKNRHEQVSVNFKYLEKLHTTYEKWLMNTSCGIPIIVIDAEEEFEDIEPRQVEIVNQVTERFPFLNKYRTGVSQPSHEKRIPKKQQWSIVKNKSSKKRGK